MSALRASVRGRRSWATDPIDARIHAWRGYATPGTSQTLKKALDGILGIGKISPPKRE
jgi:hypothetical protein